MKANEWFSQTNFRTMERISGYKQDDFSPEDGYQDFVDAVEEWWNGLSDKERETIYKQNV